MAPPSYRFIGLSRLRVQPELVGGARGGGDSLGRLSVKVGEQAFAGLMEFPLADDVVAIKHAARFVAEEDHRHAFGYPGAHEIAGGGAPAVMHVGANSLCPSGACMIKSSP